MNRWVVCRVESWLEVWFLPVGVDDCEPIEFYDGRNVPHEVLSQLTHWQRLRLWVGF